MGIEQIRAIKAGAGKKPSTPYRIPKVSAKRLELLKTQRAAQVDKTTALQKWYARIMAKEEPICWETGERINKKDAKGWHGSIAHILPKKLFPSVATHPENYLILSMWNGSHSNFDASWSKASKMKVWPVAVERFLKIYPHIAPEELKSLPEVFKKIKNANHREKP